MSSSKCSSVKKDGIGCRNGYKIYKICKDDKAIQSLTFIYKCDFEGNGGEERCYKIKGYVVVLIFKPIYARILKNKR